MARKWSLLAVLLLLCPLFARTNLVSAASSDQPGVSGSTYTSPTFGYTLSWDDSWSVSEASTSSTYDLLQLDDNVSSLDIEGYASNEDALACVTTAANGIKTEDGISKFAAAKDSNGNAKAGGDDTKSWAIYTAAYAPSGGSAQKITVYVECRALDSDDAVVRITQFVASSDYDDQAASRDIVLATLSTSGGVSQTTSSSAPGGPRTSHRDSSKGTATSTAATAPLDLPAMALLPSDIDPNAGMENSRALSFDAFVKWVADATSPDVEAPNLSQSALRLVIDSYLYAGDNIGFDNYLVAGKTCLQNYAETEDDKKIRLQRYGGASNVYYIIQPETNGATWDQYEAGIYVFPTEGAASDWQSSGYVESFPAGDNLKVDTESLGIGDASSLITYSKTSSDNTTVYYVKAVVVTGKTGITVSMISPAKSMVDEATQLVKVQFACIQSSDPCAAVPAPPDCLTPPHIRTGAPLVAPRFYLRDFRTSPGRIESPARRPRR